MLLRLFERHPGQPTGELEALVQRRLRVVDQSDRDLGFLRRNESDAQTLRVRQSHYLSQRLGDRPSGRSQ